LKRSGCRTGELSYEIQVGTVFTDDNNPATFLGIQHATPKKDATDGGAQGLQDSLACHVFISLVISSRNLLLLARSESEDSPGTDAECRGELRH
jgi:hypothetical protein